MLKIFGIVLLLLSVIVALAMIINNHVLWFIIDILVIVICAVCGLFLINKTE